MKAKALFPKAALTLLAGGALLAQTQPQITIVTDAAGFAPYPAAEGYISIFGTNLADAIYQSDGSPYSSKLGSTEIFVCPSDNITSACLSAGLTYASPTQVNAVLTGFTAITSRFPTLGGGSPLQPVTPTAYFIARVNGAIDLAASEGKTPVTMIHPFFPALFTAGYDCALSPGAVDNGPCDQVAVTQLGIGVLRGAITDLNGKLVNSGNPGKLGGYYTAWLTGLGLFTNGNPPGQIQAGFDDIPYLNTAGTGPLTAAVLYSGTSSSFPGLYQINFQLPSAPAAAFACGSYGTEISLAFQEILSETSNGYFYVTSKAVSVPITVRPGDSGCVTQGGQP